MTQTLDTTMTTIPACRRALPAAPVLIRVPALAGQVGGGARPRRRLRREVRLAGYGLIAVVPALLAYAAWGTATRPSVLLTVPSPERLATAHAADSPSPTERSLTLSLEPISAPLNAPAEVESCRVFLSGQILPLDGAEDPTHGGH